MGKPRILLADDHTLVVEAFTKLLEPDFKSLGTVPDGRASSGKSRGAGPDVIVST